MIVSSFITLISDHPDVSIDTEVLHTCYSFKILCSLLDSMPISEQQMSSTVAKNIGWLKKLFDIFEDQSILIFFF